MKGLGRGWYAVSYILALVLAIPITHKDKAYLRAKLSTLESLDVEDIPEDTFEEIIEDYETLRPISAPKKNRLVAKPLALEPDAEMLPVHYKGVKPPGVDHMEMIFVDPDTLGSHHLDKIANQVLKIEGVASGKKKSIEGKKIYSKQVKLDQVKNSQKPRRRDPQSEEGNRHGEERKRKDGIEREGNMKAENYGELRNPSAKRIISPDSKELEKDSDEHKDQVTLNRFFNDFDLSKEDASNRDNRKYGGRL